MRRGRVSGYRHRQSAREARGRRRQDFSTSARTFGPYEPDQQLLLPPSLREWLPPDHLVWFISETVDELDLSPLRRSRARGQDSTNTEPQGARNQSNGQDTAVETGPCKVQAAKAHRRATLRMDEAGARLPAVQSSRAAEVSGEFNLVCLALNLRRMAHMIRWA